MALAAAGAQAQSFCASDGVPRPQALVERFINADCASCWGDANAARPGRRELALDWIVPGSRGDDAPLSAAAIREGISRLEALGSAVPVHSGTSRSKVRGSSANLRVSHGLPFGGYLGASIELTPGNPGPWTAWLLLVETIPPGTQGTPVERNLVRNVLKTAWQPGQVVSKAGRKRLFESRPLSIPEGATPARLRVIGWVEDSDGRILGAAQSRCGER